MADLLMQAHQARAGAQWVRAIHLYQQHLQGGLNPETLHNLGLCYFGAGQYAEAHRHCGRALDLQKNLWQSAIIMAKSSLAMGRVEDADALYLEVLRTRPNNPTALLGRADLAMNHFGEPCLARQIVAGIPRDSEHHMDACLTNLMSRLYERDAKDSAKKLNEDIRSFSQEHLQLAGGAYQHRSPSTRRWMKKRPRVGLLSPQFGVSPIYFLTIAGWRHVAKGCDIILFDRGHMQDWASQEFGSLAREVHPVQHMPARELAQTIYSSGVDVLYDLGGWMDPVGLQALSLRPAAKQFKWVGGQSVTTGLNCFDGWVGDEHQSPLRLQAWYSEPLVNVPGGYATYTPPPYLPKPASRKSGSLCVFSNPAKVSHPFLNALKNLPGKKVFVHHQYRYPRTRSRIQEALGGGASFVVPGNHQEALQAVNQHAVMVDTFPYSSGLTAREAMSMGTRILVLRVGELFCERHTASLAQA